MTRRARVLISGLVQGVGFRYATQRHAGSLGLGGWVRNRADGTVEAVFEGEPDDIEAMIAWCENGPRGAVVRGVEVAWEEATGEGNGGFLVR